MKRFKILLRYLKFLTKAQTKYYLHSPFVYELAENVIYDKRWYYAFDDIEQLRRQLSNSTETISVDDYGAGSTLSSNKERKISQIARHVATPPKAGRLLFDLVKYLKAEHILELGTSLGIGTLYLAAANQKAKIWTIEGSPNIAQKAQQHFKQFNYKHIKTQIGTFEKVLPNILSKIPALDVVFLDGNHRKEPTLQYFEQCLPLAHNYSVFIFDDIHWSKEMEEAWDMVKAHPKVTVTIDLFWLGLVFFRKEQAKENFILYF